MVTMNKVYGKRLMLVITPTSRGFAIGRNSVNYRLVIGRISIHFWRR